MEIQAPEDGSTVAVNQVVIVSSIAADPNGTGVVRVELFANGESVQVDDSQNGPQTILDVAQSWLPANEGKVELTVVAYREDGTASHPAKIDLTVAGLTPDPLQSENPTLVPASTNDDSLPTAQGSGAKGRVTSLANIRQGPGPYCDVIGAAEEGAIITLLEFSKDRQWYKTDSLGGGRPGWIWVRNIDLVDGSGDIPVGTAIGCQGCGDKACNGDETCQTCPKDCGECCGNGTCQPEYGEDCGTCAADCGPCCGNGLCEAGRNEDCASCAQDCGQCCGNGVCETGRGESCATCAGDCGSCCGNGLCEAGRNENCRTCDRDCGACTPVPACGNGTCSGAETCTSCPADCGTCTPVPPSCGDGTCQASENCTSCASDCGPCAGTCGDGTCQASEDCATCAADCGACP